MCTCGPSNDSSPKFIWLPPKALALSILLIHWFCAMIYGKRLSCKFSIPVPKMLPWGITTYTDRIVWESYCPVSCTICEYRERGVDCVGANFETKNMQGNFSLIDSILQLYVWSPVSLRNPNERWFNTWSWKNSVKWDAFDCVWRTGNVLFLWLFCTALCASTSCRDYC